MKRRMSTDAAFVSFTGDCSVVSRPAMKSWTEIFYIICSYSHACQEDNRLTRKNSKVGKGLVKAFPALWLQCLRELAELFQEQHLDEKKWKVRKRRIVSSLTSSFLLSSEVLASLNWPKRSLKNFSSSRIKDTISTWEFYGGIRCIQGSDTRATAPCWRRQSWRGLRACSPRTLRGSVTPHPGENWDKQLVKAYKIFQQ